MTDAIAKRQRPGQRGNHVPTTKRVVHIALSRDRLLDLVELDGIAALHIIAEAHKDGPVVELPEYASDQGRAAARRWIDARPHLTHFSTVDCGNLHAEGYCQGHTIRIHERPDPELVQLELDDAGQQRDPDSIASQFASPKEKDRCPPALKQLRQHITQHPELERVRQNLRVDEERRERDRRSRVLLNEADSFSSLLSAISSAAASRTRRPSGPMELTRRERLAVLLKRAAPESLKRFRARFRIPRRG